MRFLQGMWDPNIGSYLGPYIEPDPEVLHNRSPLPCPPERTVGRVETSWNEARGLKSHLIPILDG